jgi:tyrosine-protein kinase Etk/Wzc
MRWVSPVRTPYGDFIINPLKTDKAVSNQVFKGEYYLQVRSIKTAAKYTQSALTVASAARRHH